MNINYLKQERIKKGITQKNGYVKVETGLTKLTIEMLIRICIILDLDIAAVTTEVVYNE